MLAVYNNFRSRLADVFSKFPPRRVKLPHELEALYGRFRAASGGRKIVGARDALRLYELVRERRPRRIIELGTGLGASASAMALALPDGGRIFSLEQDQVFIDRARDLVPEGLQRRIEFILSPARAVRVDRLPDAPVFSSYERLPTEEGPFDFVLVDGPGAWIEGGKRMSFPNGDLFFLLPHLSIGALVYVDARKGAVSLYKRFLGKYLSLVAEDADRTLFERTAAPLASIHELDPVPIASS